MDFLRVKQEIPRRPHDGSIRITLEDDDGRAMHGDKERLYDLPVGAKRLLDIAAAVECFKQVALRELTAALLTLAQHQFVAEVKKGVS